MGSVVIKEGYVYVAIAASFATQAVVKRGTHVRVESADKHIVKFTDVIADAVYEMPRDRFEYNFEPFEPTIVSPRAQ